MRTENTAAKNAFSAAFNLKCVSVISWGSVEGLLIEAIGRYGFQLI